MGGVVRLCCTYLGLVGGGCSLLRGVECANRGCLPNGSGSPLKWSGWEGLVFTLYHYVGGQVLPKHGFPLGAGAKGGCVKVKGLT